MVGTGEPWFDMMVGERSNRKWESEVFLRSVGVEKGMLGNAFPSVQGRAFRRSVFDRLDSYSQLPLREGGS
jgi:hypothetical protein